MVTNLHIQVYRRRCYKAGPLPEKPIHATHGLSVRRTCPVGHLATARRAPGNIFILNSKDLHTIIVDSDSFQGHARCTLITVPST